MGAWKCAEGSKATERLWLGEGFQEAVQNAPGLTNREGGDPSAAGMHDGVAVLTRVMHGITDGVGDGKEAGSTISPVVCLA